MNDKEFPRSSRWPLVLLWPALMIWIVTFVILLAFEASLILAALSGALAAFVLINIILLSATKLCDALVDAQPADPHKHAVLFSLTEALCTTHGLNIPQLFVKDDSSTTVLAYGLHGRICVSEGFFSNFSVVEQEAVVAHALCRIKRGHARSDTLAAVVFGLFLAPLGMRNLAGSCATTLRGRHALLASDFAAVSLTRYPPGLMSALRIMQQDSELPKLAPCVDHLQALPKQPRKQMERFDSRVGLLAEI